MVLKSRRHTSLAGHPPSVCLGAAFLPHQLLMGWVPLARAPQLVKGCADTAHSSFHPATPESAVLGKMGAAAFKQHLFILETISEGS